MCKKFITGLLGGQSGPAKRAIEQSDNSGGRDTMAEVKDTDVVNTGREASGRVKLSGGTKGEARVAGLKL
jgi:hypothetical protein